jgi:hypothetical protein
MANTAEGGIWPAVELCPDMLHKNTMVAHTLHTAGYKWSAHAGGQGAGSSFCGCAVHVNTP